MSAAAALGAYSCGSRGALCRVRAVPADITTAMSDRYESIETSLQFSSSSSFSTVLPPIGEEGCTDVRVLVVAGASSGKRQNEKGNDTHARSLQRVVPPSFLHNEGAAASVESQPLAHRALSASSSGRESGNRVHDSATATADSEYYFLSTIRGSTSPPGMSTYFGGAVAPTAPVARVTETAMSLMSDIESFEDIETPRSSVVSAVAAEQVSRTISPSPPTPSLHSRKTGARGDLLYAEVAVVNAEEARAAHALLTSSSAAIIARYRLVKLKVVQRIYRIYYDKWRWRIFQSASAVPPLHVTMGIQTSAPYQRSASVETDFADIESFHGSRSMSLSGDSPGVHVAVTAPPRDAQPLRSSPATPTPSPRLGEGESERGISVTWSPAPAFRLETFASASPPSPPQPSKYRTPTFSIPPAAPPTDGIGVRTKPAKLVDFGHPSEGPQRKTLHIASTPAANREMPMTLSGRGSPSPAPLRRQFAKKPAFNVTSPVLASLSTFAEYADRRHELLVDIHDGLEDDVRKMEERARQAVAHASAVTEACRAQEAECLEYIERLEDNIRDLHRAKQECAAELKGLQTSTERSRQDLEKELHDLRQAVEETRRQKLLAQEEQQHYEMLRDAAKRHYELIEAYLKEFTAKVEFHFHEAVASLQATAQERKRWADEQRALNEKRVREAALGAEKSDFSAFLCRATEDAERTGAAKPAEQRAAAVEPQLMRDLERDVAALAASVAARLQLIVEQESAAEAGLERLPLRITDESCDLIYSLCRTAAQSTLDGDQESWKRDQWDSCEAASVSHATRALGTLEVTVTHALLDLCAAAASASSTPSAKCRACPHESPTGAAAPLHIRAANASASSSAPPSSAGKALPPTPVQAPSLPGSSRRQSESVTFPERRLIDDFSCTTDAFATIFTPRK